MSSLCKKGHVHGTFRSACDCDRCRRDNRKRYSRSMKKARDEADTCMEKHARPQKAGAASR